MSLLVFGTVALDDVQTPAGLRQDLLGGSAAHFSMSARLFSDVHLVGVVGKDFPESHTAFLRHKGVDLESLKIVDGKTFHWKGEYKAENLNQAVTLATELGVLANLGAEVSQKQRDIPHIFLANLDPDMQSDVLGQMRAPKFVGLDSMNLWITHKRPSLLSLMKKVHLFVANDAEARMLSGEHNLIKAAKFLRNCGPKFIVIKKGEHGVLFYSDKFRFAFPAYPIEQVIDPTGAGDTFAGGLMGYLIRSSKINEEVFRKAVLYATAVASFNVEGFGMETTAGLTMAKVNQRMKGLVKFIEP